MHPVNHDNNTKSKKDLDKTTKEEQHGANSYPPHGHETQRRKSCTAVLNH